MIISALIIVGLMVGMSLLGFGIRKAKLVGEENKGLSVTLLYIAQPLMIVSVLQANAYQNSVLGNMGLTFLFAVVTQTVLLIAAFFIFKFNKDDKERRVYAFASVFSNCGFMGIPVMQALLPDNPAVPFFAAMYVISFNILSWTAGVYVITGDKKYISLKNAFLNPPTVALIFALPLFFLNIKLPEQVLNIVDMLGAMTTPLAMIILGIKLADLSVKKLFCGVSLYVSMAVKLLIAPLFTYLLLLPFGFDQSIVIALTLAAAMPTASMTVVFAERFGGDVASGVKTQLLSTFLSILTIPLITLLF